MRSSEVAVMVMVMLGGMVTGAGLVLMMLR